MNEKVLEREQMSTIFGVWCDSLDRLIGSHIPCFPSAVRCFCVRVSFIFRHSVFIGNSWLFKNIIERTLFAVWVIYSGLVFFGQFALRDLTISIANDSNISDPMNTYLKRLYVVLSKNKSYRLTLECCNCCVCMSLTVHNRISSELYSNNQYMGKRLAHSLALVHCRFYYSINDTVGWTFLIINCYQSRWHWKKEKDGILRWYSHEHLYNCIFFYFFSISIPIRLLSSVFYVFRFIVEFFNWVKCSCCLIVCSKLSASIQLAQTNCRNEYISQSIVRALWLTLSPDSFVV